MHLSPVLSKSFDNSLERGIRKLKIKQKVSGTFRSDNGADAFMALHSVTDTAWKIINHLLRLYLHSIECEVRCMSLAE